MKRALTSEKSSELTPKKLGVEFVEGEVTEVERVNGNFSVNIDGGESLETKTVIYAAGTQRRKLGVKAKRNFRVTEFLIVRCVMRLSIRIKLPW